MKDSTKNLNKIYNTTVTANKTLVDKACGYTGCKPTATISLVILACLHEPDHRILKHSVENYLLLLPYVERHNTTNYNIHGKGCVNTLKKLTQKLALIDKSIDSASKAVDHALVQFITAYEKENSLKRPIKLMGSKWDKNMQEVINRIMERCHCTSIVETCAGALGIFCNINTPNDVLLNDLDNGKIAFYKTLQNNCTKLLIDMMLTPSAKKKYERFKRKLRISNRSDYQTATAYFYVNFYDYHYNRENYNAESAGFSLQKVCNYLRISKKLTGVKFNNINLLNLIPKYRKKADTLIICDPPYENTKSYKSNLTSEEHDKLAKMLNNHQGQFIYFCRVSARGKNPSRSAKIITAKVEDNYANQDKKKKKKTYYIDIALHDNTSESSTKKKKPSPTIIERIITNFAFEGATEFIIPTSTELKGGDSNEK